MLVLSRKVGEKIHVSDSIVIEVRRIRGNQVSLAIEAPRNIPVFRSEIANQPHPEANQDDCV